MTEAKEETLHMVSAIILLTEIKIHGIRLMVVLTAISKTIMLLGEDKEVPEGKVEYLIIIIGIKMRIQALVAVGAVLVQ
jgi:hypothetical protein